MRDSAAYVLWSLARTQGNGGIEPYASDLARDLAIVALFDREVHVRRAASAAFQENVGRMVTITSSTFPTSPALTHPLQNLFPHGIAILGLIDFYSVGIRRHSFLVTAPEVSRCVATHADSLILLIG